MTLEAGTRLGAYVILSPLGAGGMGEVYRAEDTKLKREVAIKVLPDHFAADEGRMKRFDREAQVLASLNHPHIAAIYGREEEAGVHAIVLELVEGPTLAEKIEQGGMALSEALDIAKQIAEALESAHEQGIVHRDLKPPNVKVRDDGTVKVLDYGLAKALERDVPEEDQEDSPTRLRQGFGEASSATLAGVILGTAAYMSPEQARGGRVDRRSDIWSFGVVLWEMLTGERLFTGETASDVLAQVLTKEPDWTSLPAGTPPLIRRLLERCLCKEKRHRLAGISAALFAIDESQAGDRTVETRERFPWRYVSAVLAVALVATLWGWWRNPPPVERSTKRLRVEISPGAPLDLNFGGNPTLSPNGKHLAYVGETGLEVRALDRLVAETLSGTGAASHPFFSPDGQWIAFYAGSALKKISISGGAPVTLCEPCLSSERSPGIWGPDDAIVFAQSSSDALVRVSPDGGQPERLVTTSEDEAFRHDEPHFLPGGEALLLTSRQFDSPTAERNIEVLDLRSGERKLVHRGGRAPKYLSTGHLAFVHDGTLFAAPFDLGRLELSAPPVSLVDGIAYSRFGQAHYSISETGVLVYVPERRASDLLTIAWVARDGATTPLSVAPGDYVNVELSPDGTKLALEHLVDSDIWVHDLTRGGRSRLTLHEGRDWVPVWSADGSQITFGSDRSGQREIHWRRADGTGTDEQLTETADANTKWPNSWSPDGKTLAFTAFGGDSLLDIWTMTLDDNGNPGPPVVFAKSSVHERDAVFSPDGRWLAYMAKESGQWDVYVRPFPQGEGRTQISTGGGWNPRWAGERRELFYQEGDRMMLVSYSMEDGRFRAEPPRPLFTVSFAGDVNHPAYDVTSDGKRFIVLLRSAGGSNGSTQVVMVLDWFDELRRLVPTDD